MFLAQRIDKQGSFLVQFSCTSLFISFVGDWNLCRTSVLPVFGAVAFSFDVRFFS